MIHGCDLSPAMLKIAAEAGGEEVDLRVADMRALPHLGAFDLVLSLNDSVNYLLGDEDLVSALVGMRRNLADSGLLVFDVNSSSTYASGYAEDREVEFEGAQWLWRGRGEVGPAIFESEISGDRLQPIQHLERFRSGREVLSAMKVAGIETLAALGMSEAEGEVVAVFPLRRSARLQARFHRQRSEFR